MDKMEDNLQPEIPAEEIERIPEEPEISAEEIEETNETETPEENTETIPQNAGKSGKGKKIAIGVIASVLCVLLAGVMAVFVISGTDGFDGLKTKMSAVFGKEDSSATQPAATQPAATEPQATEATPVTSYTVADEGASLISPNVIATMNGAQLTNGELQVYYMTSVLEYYAQYGEYLYYYAGIDLMGSPLDELIYDPELGTTWQEIFLKNALDKWQLYTSVSEYARESGFVLSEEGQAYIAGLDDRINEMATSSNCATAEEFVTTQIGASATVEGLRNYMEAEYYYVSYCEHLQESLEPNMEQMELYFTENAQSFAEKGVTKESGDVVDIRHILIVPENGTKDENNNTVYGEEDWAACRDKAQSILDTWMAGEATEESFALLAQQNSADGNANQGGIYTGVTKGYMVESFDAWIFDESRQYGDTDLVKTDFGYHVMFFINREPSWVSHVRNSYIQEAFTAHIEGILADNPLQTDYEGIALT